MLSFRTLLTGLMALTLLAQQEPPAPVFRTTVENVVAPVTVTDRDDNYILNLKPSDFRLLDNDKPQDIQVDVSFIPISLVVAVQANWDMQGILPKVQKIGSLLQGVVTGEQGEIAVMAFDHRIQVLQDFTTDADLVSKALQQLKAGSSSSRKIDATSEAIRMLSKRPVNRRRILMLISETRDRASEGKLSDALTLAQLGNVIIYPININRAVAALTSKSMPPRPDPLPPGARPLPPGVPPAIAAGSQTSAANSASLIPLFVEIFNQTKAIFVDNPSEVFAGYTGGREYSFLREKDLESAIQRIGQELHSQYLLSYTPNNKMEGGFHEITVQVLDALGRPRRDIKLTTRRGYWLAAMPE